MTGIGRYALELGRALKEADADGVHLYPVDPSAAATGPAVRRWPNVRAVARQIPFVHNFVHAERARRFRRASTVRACGVYHEPNYLLRPFDGYRVVTVHDLSHIRHPDYHARRSRRFLEQRLSHSLALAHRVIVPTAFVRDELADLFGLPAARVRVVHEGVSPTFGPVDPARLSGVLAPLGLAPDGYVLTVGTREPRKNLANLVAAYGRLLEPVRHRYPLVVVGAAGWRHGKVDRELGRLERAGDVVLPGYVDEGTLAGLYAGAAVFAYMSWYEGFGLPPLEAMASGAPVVTSTAAALTEVAGDAARRAPAGDVPEITEVLCAVLEDPRERARLREVGRVRASAFSWSDAARQTLAVYGELLGGEPGSR